MEFLQQIGVQHTSDSTNDSPLSNSAGIRGSVGIQPITTNNLLGEAKGHQSKIVWFIVYRSSARRRLFTTFSMLKTEMVDLIARTSYFCNLWEDSK